MLARPRRKAPAPASMETAYVPAPTGGLNTISPGSEMGALDCILIYNLIAAEYGLRSRLGSREWCTGLTGAIDNKVRTVMSFTGAAASGSDNKVFATTSTGIWDVTASSATPTQVLAFGTTTGDAGFGAASVFVTSAGHFLLYCDEVNGYHVFTQSAGTWAAITMGGGGTQVSGVDPATFCFVFAFKERLWFVPRNSASAWYLSAGAVYGAATEFPMGRKFTAGGGIRGLWSWTYDGGAGLDDSMVAVSDGGDVLVWQLTDPASPTSTLLRGVWSLGGSPPAGRRIATTRGGDLLLLSRLGVLPLSKLVLGSGTEDRSVYATAKIANLFNQLMLSKSALKTWSMHIHPEENALVVTVPGYGNDNNTEQLVMSLSNRSWFRFRDLPWYSAQIHEGKVYFGSAAGKVYINDGYIDGVTLADPNAYTSIQYSMITAFRNLGNGRQKQVQVIRPTILSESASPTFEVHARYKFDQTEPSAVAEGVPGQGSWDVGVWDTAVWGGDYSPSQAVRGAAGMGTDVAIALRGTATSRTIFVGCDVGFSQGGFL